MVGGTIVSYEGRKFVRILGRIKCAVRIMILQYANRAVEIVRSVDKVD